MRTLAIDFGEKRVGLAVSDETGLIARGLTTLRFAGMEKLLMALETIIMEQQVAKIIVGLPLNLAGQDSVQTKKVRSFIAKLTKRFRRRVPVASWDERLSTVTAQEKMLEAGLSIAKRRNLVDQSAAAVILQDYLDSEQSEP